MTPSDPSAPLTLAQRMDALRTSRGLSDGAVARASGLSRQAVEHLRHRRDGGSDSASLATVRALARALECDPAWLAFGPPYSPSAAPVVAPVEAVSVVGRVAADPRRLELPATAPTPPPAEAPPPPRRALAPLAFRTRVEAVPTPSAPVSPSADPLSALRAALAGGMSQRAAAREAGVSQGALSEALAGRRQLRPATLSRLAAWASSRGVAA